MTGLVLLDRLRDLAEREPRRPALRAGDAVLDAGDLVSRATAVADALRASGIGAEDVVATVLPRGGNSIVAMLGIWAAGAAYLPVDPKWPGRRRAQVIDGIADAAVVGAVADGVADGVAGMPNESRLLVSRLRPGRVDGQDRTAGTVPRNLAYVLCTSGSTGTPLAVGVEIDSLDNYTRYLHDLVRQPDVHPGDIRVMLSADLAFDASLRPVMLLGAGAELVVAPDLTESSWQDHIDCIVERRITVISGAPSWYSGLLAAGFRPDDSEVRLAFVGGEAVPNGIVRPLVSAGCRVVVQYGPTETTIAATGGPLTDDFDDAPLGEPLPGVQVALYRNTHLEPAAGGEAAYLYVAGAGVARGYLRNPRLTAERFVPDPAGPPGSRQFRTGDLASLTPRGTYAFQGRKDDQVKINGRRIELGEVSSVLNRHPTVTHSVAFVQRDTTNPILVACYVGEGGVDDRTAGADLRTHLADALPGYAVPTILQRVDALPMTERGKVDLPALRRLVEPPGSATPTPVPPAEDAMTDLQKQVLGIVATTLDAPCTLDDEFFALGLSSLDSLNILAEIREDLGVRVRLRDFYQARTVRSVCALIEGAP